MKHIRLAVESLGVVLYLGIHVLLAFVYMLGSSLQGVHPMVYWTAIGAGYLSMLGIAVARPGRLNVVPARWAFDAWLLSAVPASAFAFVFVAGRWPLQFPSWGAHGFGAQGGEANAAFFPWLQGLLWVIVGFAQRELVVGRIRRGLRGLDGWAHKNQ